MRQGFLLRNYLGKRHIIVNFKGSMNAIFISFIVVLHSFSILNFNNKTLGLQFYNFSYYSIITLIIFNIITRIKMIKFNRHHFFFIVFSVYCAMNLTMRGKPDVLYASIFLFWALYITIAFPLFYKGRKDAIKIMIKDLVFYLSLFLLFLFIYSYYNGIPVFRTDFFSGTQKQRIRITSGLENPGYYSELAFTLIWTAFLAYIISGSKFYLLILITSGVILVGTNTRALIFGSIFGIIIYIISVKKINMAKLKLYLITLTLIFIFIILLFSLNIGGNFLSKLNTLTSGRVAAWDDAISKTYENDATGRFLIGSGNNIWNIEMSAQARAAHYDNLYLEIFLRYGITGLVLLICAFCDILFAINNQIKRIENKKKKKVLIWANAVILVIMFVGMFNTVIPSLGNPINIVLFPLALSVVNWIQFV